MVAFTRENGSFVGARWRGRPSNRERTLFWPVLAQEDADGNVQWFLADHEGSVRDVVGLVSGNWQVVSHITYTSFGSVVTATGDTPRFGFVGRELDGETQLYYNRARYYDGASARFLSEDPSGFRSGDDNLYRYVGNSPDNGTDPTGMSALWKWFDWKGSDPDHPGGWYDCTVAGTAIHLVHDFFFETAYSAIMAKRFLCQEMQQISDNRKEGLGRIVPTKGQSLGPGAQDPLAKDYDRVKDGVANTIKTVPGSTLTGPPTDPTSVLDVGVTAGVNAASGALDAAKEGAEAGAKKDGTGK